MEKSSLVKNSIYNVIYRVLNIVFPFITSIYVARVLLADSIGKVAAAQNMVSYFTILAAMGIPTYGIKVIAQYKIESKDLSKAFSELFIINFLLTVISSLFYFIIIGIVPFFEEKREVYYITGMTLVLNIINVDWFYQGIQEYAYITIRSFIVKCISLLSMFLLVKSKDDYLIYAWISAGALVGNYLFNIIKLRKYVSVSVTGLKFKFHLQHIVTLFVASLAAEVYVLADTTMLDVMCGSEVVGYYTMSMRIMRIMRGLVVAVSAVFLPQLSSYYHNNKKDEFIGLANKGIHILLCLSVPVAAGIALVADDAILVLFGEGFGNSIYTTVVLSVSVISVALSNYIGLQIFVILGKEKITTISTIVGAVVNIVLNYFLILNLQHFGAAIASAITEVCVTAIQIIMSRKYIKLRFEYKKVAISVGTMAIMVFIVHQLPINIYVRLVGEVALGICVYFSMMYILKDSFVTEITTMIRKTSKK